MMCKADSAHGPIVGLGLARMAHLYTSILLTPTCMLIVFWNVDILVGPNGPPALVINWTIFSQEKCNYQLKGLSVVVCDSCGACI